MKETNRKKEKMKKLTKKQKEEKTWKFITKYMKRFDALMNDASKECEKIKVGCSVHALSSQIVHHIAGNMTNYYGSTERLRDTFQCALDTEVNHRYIQAKEERENATLN